MQQDKLYLWELKLVVCPKIQRFQVLNLLEIMISIKRVMEIYQFNTKYVMNIKRKIRLNVIGLNKKIF